MATTLVALQIEKGVPMPPQRFRGRSPFTVATEAALSQMQSGDSFSYQDDSKNGTLRTSIRETAKRLKTKVTIHKISEGQYRVWKL